MTNNLKFQIGQSVIYPSHGVGIITNIENQVICGNEIMLYVISFPTNKMFVRVPVETAVNSGLRAPVSKNEIIKINRVLESNPKPGNRMWSRRAQEYEAKINSGDILQVAEVVRDLFKNVECDRSFSERTIYESALNRLAGEIAILENIPHSQAIVSLLDILRQKYAA